MVCVRVCVAAVCVFVAYRLTISEWMFVLVTPPSSLCVQVLMVVTAPVLNDTATRYVSEISPPYVAFGPPINCTCGFDT